MTLGDLYREIGSTLELLRRLVDAGLVAADGPVLAPGAPQDGTKTPANAPLRGLISAPALHTVTAGGLRAAPRLWLASLATSWNQAPVRLPESIGGRSPHQESEDRSIAVAKST